MHTYSGSLPQAPVATGEGVVVSADHLQGHEAISAAPAMDKANAITSAQVIQGDAQASIDNVSRGIAAQVKAMALDNSEMI